MTGKTPSHPDGPPMGWNSWDVYGASVREFEVLENARLMASQLAPFGWQYVVVDIQWYEPDADSSAYRPFVPLEMDDFSRLVPSVKRFPSAVGGRGFGELSARIHEMGLKFGIHAMRGVPRQAVHANTPLLGTDARARDIAQTSSTCPWNTDMYGVDPLAPGAQEYYDSVLSLYASWGVDFLKVDDILRPYAAGEIELIRRAIERTGTNMVLSLSCGPPALEHADHVSRNADMWRMTDDFWDRWEDLYNMFEACRLWAPYCRDGRWPDADMLPLGKIALRSREHGVGERWARFSKAEQRTLMTLWTIARSPLMLGSYLPEMDEWTRSLLTNPEVIGVLNGSKNPRQLMRHGDKIVWVSEGDGCSYVALFNTGTRPVHVAVPLDEVTEAGEAALRDLWARQDLGRRERVLEAEVDSHGARLFKLTGRR